MFRRSVVPRFCQHKTHWWPHWRLCFRRYMLYGTCRYHGRKCVMGCTEEQIQYNIDVLARAYKNDEIPRRKVRRIPVTIEEPDDQGDGPQVP